MKTIGIIALVLIIGVIIYYQTRTILEKLVFKFSFKGANLSAFNFSSLLTEGETSAKLLLSLNIKNNNNFSIPFNKTKIWLYYDNTLIAETSGVLYARNFNIPAKGETDVTDYVNVHVNSALINLGKETLAKTNPRVYYTVKITIFGISFTYKDYFTSTT